MGRTGEKERRQHRREGGGVGGNLVPRGPRRLPPHLQDDWKCDGGSREGQPVPAHRTARAHPLPESRDEIRAPEPDDDGHKGSQVLRLAHRIRGLLHDHNDPTHAGAVVFCHERGLRLDRRGG